MPLVASDESLWQASASGDQRAFSELYERHARTIYNYLFRRLADWSEAEDLTAVVFLEAFRRRNEVVVVEGKLLPWLYGIATNVLRNRRRALWRHRHLVAQLACEPGNRRDARRRRARRSRGADAFGPGADREVAAPAAGRRRPLRLVRTQLRGSRGRPRRAGRNRALAPLASSRCAWRNSTAPRDIRRSRWSRGGCREMTEIPGEFPLPEEAFQRQRSLLGAHVEGERRPSRRTRRRVVAVAAVILVGGLLVTPAFGIGSRLLDLVQGAPRPPEIRVSCLVARRAEDRLHRRAPRRQLRHLRRQRRRERAPEAGAQRGLASCLVARRAEDRLRRRGPSRQQRPLRRERRRQRAAKADA